MKSKIDKKKVIALVIIVIAIVSIFFFTRSKQCNSDENCFNSYAARCSKAGVNTLNKDNTYHYEILGNKRENCIVEVTLLRLSETQPVDMKQALEGRSMSCAIPRTTLQNQTMNSIQNLNDYCTGPLKEAILEITLDKMYDLIVKNIGPIATGFADIVRSQ